MRAYKVAEGVDVGYAEELAGDEMLSQLRAYRKLEELLGGYVLSQPRANKLGADVGYAEELVPHGAEEEGE